MPFTPSHIAAVLPLRRWAPALPLSALALGSMSPDAVYFVPGLTEWGGWTHQPWAVVSLDVVIGMVLWWLWRLITPPLHQVAPRMIGERWRPADGRPRVGAASLAVALGAATHVFWDSFTHAGRWATTHWALLSNTYPSPLGGEWAGYRYAQYLSGVLGLAVLGAVAWRQPRVAVESVRSSLPRLLLVPAVVVASLVGATARVLATGAADAGAQETVFAGITGAIGAAVVMLLVLVSWQAGMTASQTRSTRYPQPNDVG